jgi:predicted DNA repair protein MutK
LPSGLAALLDDVAAIAKMAAASVDDVTAAAGAPAPRRPGWWSTTRR